MTAAFDAQIAADTRTPVWLVVLTTSRRCANTYASAVGPSTCTAVDAGDGARCYYSYCTCQDRANFRAESHSLAFTSSDVPLPPDVAAEYPNARTTLQKLSPVAQSIALSSSSTSPGHLVVTLEDTGGDSDGGPFDLDKTVRNSTRSGLTMQRWLAQWPNFGHMTLEARFGFLADGFAITDWDTRFKGTLSGIEIAKDGKWTLRGEDVLTKLKKELPRQYSSTVRLVGLVAPADTAWTVTDTSEMRAGDTLLVPGLAGEDEVVRIASVDDATTITVGREVNGTHASYVADDTALVSILDYVDQLPLDIVQALLAQAGVTDIDAPSFAAMALHAGPLTLSRRIAAGTDGYSTTAGAGSSSATAASKLISEILDLYQGALLVTPSGSVGIALPHPVGPDDNLEVIDDERILVNTSHGQAGETQRLTHVAVVWNKTSDEDFTVTAAVNGETFVADYFGSEPEDRREKKIETSWAPEGSSVPWLAAVRWSTIFAMPPRGLEWDASIRDDSIAVGDVIETDTTEVQDAHGANLAKRMMIITRRPSDDMAKISFGAQATGFDATTAEGSRWAFIAPNASPDYGAASDADKLYGFWCASDGTVVGDPGYVVT